jgi:hypothetical protein
VPPVKEVGYSDEGVEKGWTEGGGVVDEWGSEGGSPSGEGLPRIVERMEYSRLAPSEPKEKDGTLRDELYKGSFGVKPSVTNR